MKTNKILLIRPRIQIVDYGNVVPPLNLGYLASSLIQSGFDVKIIDQIAWNYDIRDLLRIIWEEEPATVGYSLFTPEVASVFHDLQKIKNVYPDIMTVLGGPHPSALPIETMQECADVDVVVAGEGEQTLVELMGVMRNGKSFSEIKGICYRSGKDIVRTAARPLIEDIDTLPFPAYDLLDMDKYIYWQKGFSGQRYMNIISSRSCPNKCTFCSNAVFGRRVRYRSPENVMAEIKLLYEKYDVRALSFLDDTFTINKARAFEICERIIESGLKINWGCMSAVNTVTPELLKMMRAAGCQKISYGVESGNPEQLKSIKKNITLNQAREAFRITHEAGIDTLAFFILGLPGETEKTLTTTRQFAMALDPDYISVAVLCPLPGSDIYTHNKDSLPRDWAHYQLTPFNELPAVSITALSVERLQKELKNFYRSFYLRPSYIVRILRRVRSWQELFFYIKKAYYTGKYWI